MARMRTIPEAIRHFKTVDPNTALTQHAIRQMVLTSRIPHVSVGAKRLIDVDLLERFLSGEYIPDVREDKEVPVTIRRLEE